MTHHTDAERAEFEAWYEADAMPAEANWFAREKDDPSEYLHADTNAAWRGWQAARRAPAAPVPQEPTSKQVVLGAGALLGQPENTADNRHPDWHSAVAKARSVYLAMLAAAPQPPEAAPVRKPLTDAEIESATGAKQGTPLFLAAKGFTIAIERAHGIQERST